MGQFKLTHYQATTWLDSHWLTNSQESSIYRMTGIIKIGLCLTMCVGLYAQVPSSQTNSTNTQPPVVDLSAPGNDTLDSTTRAIRSSRHNNPHGHELSELPPGIEPYPEITHWSSRLSALPVTASDAIVVATVQNAQAFLSSDGHSVYSEFTLVPDRVLKGTPLASGQQALTAERDGGAVKFASGKIEQFRIHQQGVPQNRHAYLFFLKWLPDSKDFTILTAYDLTSGRVEPLDGNDSSKPSQFSQYKGLDSQAFITQVTQEAEAK